MHIESEGPKGNVAIAHLVFQIGDSLNAAPFIDNNLTTNIFSSDVC